MTEWGSVSHETENAMEFSGMFLGILGIEYREGLIWMQAVRRKQALGERQSLLLALRDTRLELGRAYSGFNYAQDSDLISAYIFEIKALQARYSYLLKQIKALE